jgi:dihydrodipicolinate synthase/N-acetylneuraminate lyase
MPSCAAPGAHAQVFDLWQEGRHDEARDEWNRILPLVFWRWHTSAGEAGKLFLKQMGVFEHAYCRQQVTVSGQHSGAEVDFGSLKLDDADREEMLAILATMGEPPY